MLILYPCSLYELRITGKAHERAELLEELLDIYRNSVLPTEAEYNFNVVDGSSVYGK